MLVLAHRFIDLVQSLSEQKVLTQPQWAAIAAARLQGFPTIRPEAFRALRDVLHLRQIPVEGFAENWNAVLCAYKNNPGALPGAPDTPQRAITKRTKYKQNREGALQGKSSIFPHDRTER